jgi:hypothetical protein
MSLPPASDNYVGEPQYPSPWTTTRPLEGLRDTDAAKIICLAPDVCLTPVGSSVVPIPYQIVDYCGHDHTYTPSVRFTGQKAMVMRSNTTHVHGDAPGTRKGVKSGAVEDICEPIGHASQVRAEGSHVIRHLDRFWMNKRNTQGEAQFVRTTRTYEAPKDDDPVPGSLRLSRANDGEMMSDASPEPLIMGAQYAQAAPVQQPVPGGGSSVPAPRPSPQGPGTVIRPGPERAPQWYNNKTPPHLQRGPDVGRWARYGVWARRLTAIGILIEGIFIPSNGANLSDVVPRDGFEEDVVRTFAEGINQGADSWAMRDWAMEQIHEHRSRPQQNERPRPQAVPQPDTVTVDREQEFPCLVGPYSQIAPICPGEAHHIVPDMALRYGTRDEGAAGLNRIPNAPSLREGMTVCLTQGMHGGLHGSLNSTLAGLGSTQTPVGTAPMIRILNASTASIDSIVGLSRECKERAKAAARLQMMPLAAQPGRTTVPLPSPAAVEVLRRGHY